MKLIIIFTLKEDQQQLNVNTLLHFFQILLLLIVFHIRICQERKGEVNKQTKTKQTTTTKRN